MYEVIRRNRTSVLSEDVASDDRGVDFMRDHGDAKHRPAIRLLDNLTLREL